MGAVAADGACAARGEMAPSPHAAMLWPPSPVGAGVGVFGRLPSQESEK